MTQEKRRFSWFLAGISVSAVLILLFGQYIHARAMTLPGQQYMDLLQNKPQLAEEEFFDYEDTGIFRVTELTNEIAALAQLTPPESARLMAYVSSIYYDGLAQGASLGEAQELAARISEYCLPDFADQIRDIYTEEFQTRSTDLGFGAEGLLNLYIFRADKDNFKNDLTFDIPTDPGSWVMTTTEPPLSPLAGNWSHWLVPSGTEFDVAAPALSNSQEYEEEKQVVVEAATNRTPEQAKAALYWGGYSDEGIYPVELWVDIMYEELDTGLTEMELAMRQKLLSQSVADSFIEAWRIKYTYWTERPDMIIPEFETLFENPNFPSYVSGHATVSQTAADILSAIEPEKEELFQAKAQEAADSRLWAGVHFDMDNAVGQDLGSQVAASILESTSVSFTD